MLNLIAVVVISISIGLNIQKPTLLTVLNAFLLALNVAVVARRLM